MFNQKKGELRNLSKTKGFFIIILVPFFLFFLMFIFYFLNLNFSKELPVCGDGTSYGNCSENKPYLCNQGYLIKNVNLCGCPDFLEPAGNECISNYDTSPKNITLEYILRGEEGKINFLVYGGASDYFLRLPRSIHYFSGEKPSRQDFKLRDINNQEQREFILPIVTKIQNIAEGDDQARIAVSLVQKIPFAQSNRTVSLGKKETNYSRYPYSVLYDKEGVCGEKSELLALLLKELGYGVSLFYYGPENHEAVGLKCPVKKSMYGTGYCFIETSGPSIISNNKLIYNNGVKLETMPEIILISNGKTFGEDFYEYKDAKKFIKVFYKLRNTGKINLFETIMLKKLDEKYGLVSYYNI